MIVGDRRPRLINSSVFRLRDCPSTALNFNFSFSDAVAIRLYSVCPLRVSAIASYNHALIRVRDRAISCRPPIYMSINALIASRAELRCRRV